MRNRLSLIRENFPAIFCLFSLKFLLRGRNVINATISQLKIVFTTLCFSFYERSCIIFPSFFFVIAGNLWFWGISTFPKKASTTQHQQVEDNEYDRRKKYATNSALATDRATIKLLKKSIFFCVSRPRSLCHGNFYDGKYVISSRFAGFESDTMAS